MTRARDLSKLLGTANNGVIPNSNLGVSFENISDTGTQGTKVASGTTNQRGSTAGQIRFNTTTGLAEYYTGTEFKVIDAPPTVTAISPLEVDSTAGGNITFTITGSNFGSGAVVKFIGSDATEITASTTTVNSGSSISAVIARSSFVNAKEPYDVRVLNTSGLSGTLDNQINVDSNPTWSTASGSLGTIAYNSLSGINISTSATDVDGDTVSYSILSGSLPTALSLNSSTGAITGTTTPVANNTTSSFTLRATANSKTADRAFSITRGGFITGYGTEYAISFNNNITNQGTTSATLTSHGNFAYTTSPSKFNTYVGNFPNTGASYIRIPNSSDLQFGTGDFTIEGWVYLRSDVSGVDMSARIFQMGLNESNGIACIYNGTSEFTFSNTHSNFVTDSPTNWFDNWRYFTVTHSSGTTRLFRDGVIISSNTGLNSVTNTGDLFFGVFPSATSSTRTNMALSEWQITKGLAKYTANFTPPTTALII